MSNSVLTDMFKEHGNPNNLLMIFDVDLTLRDTMCTATPVNQRLMITELNDRTEGGVIIASGRSAGSIDTTFSGQLPLSAEHHSAIRIIEGGDVISLVHEADTLEIGKVSSELIGDTIKIVHSGHEVREQNAKSAVVFPEVKQFAVALVHSLEHDKVQENRQTLKEIAEQTILIMNLQSTHEVVMGSDAVEIVPAGINPKTKARDILSEKEINRLEKDGSHKGTAVHNFMSLAQNADRVPYMFGDSSPDGHAMNECVHYGGAGIWVLNANTSIPDQFAEAVGNRIIANHQASWDHIEAALESLRKKDAKVSLPKVINRIMSM